MKTLNLTEEEEKVEFFNITRLRKACAEGDIESVKNLISENKTKNIPENEENYSKELVLACEKGHKDIVKYLLTSLDCENKVEINYRQHSPISKACENGHIEVVRCLLAIAKEFDNEYMGPRNIVDKGKEYDLLIHGVGSAASTGNVKSLDFLLTYPGFNYHEEFLNHNLIYACKNGCVEVVQYLLNSENIDVHANIHFDNERPLETACRHGELEVVKYLVDSSDLKEHADIYVNYGKPFVDAYGNERLDIIEYFIFDKEFEPSDETFSLMDECDNEIDLDNDIKKLVLKMFEVRDLNLSISRDLKDKDPKQPTKKSKI